MAGAHRIGMLPRVPHRNQPFRYVTYCLAVLGCSILAFAIPSK
jgi:hypothetical protein